LISRSVQCASGRASATMAHLLEAARNINSRPRCGKSQAIDREAHVARATWRVGILVLLCRARTGRTGASACIARLCAALYAIVSRGFGLFSAIPVRIALSIAVLPALFVVSPPSHVLIPVSTVVRRRLNFARRIVAHAEARSSEPSVDARWLLKPLRHRRRSEAVWAFMNSGSALRALW
jgi:hypothetical protein